MYLFRSFKPGNRIPNSLRQRLSITRAILIVELLRKSFYLLDRARDAPPRVCLQLRVALAVDAEGCVVAALDEPVAAIVAVAAPGLDREVDVGVVFLFACAMLVGFFDHVVDDF